MRRAVVSPTSYRPQRLEPPGRCSSPCRSWVSQGDHHTGKWTFNEKSGSPMSPRLERNREGEPAQANCFRATSSGRTREKETKRAREIHKPNLTFSLALSLHSSRTQVKLLSHR